MQNVFQEKECVDCSATKPISDFYFHKGNQSYRGSCKKCIWEETKKYRERKKRGEDTSRKIFSISETELRKLYLDDKLSLEEIGKIYNVSKCVIYRSKKKFNLPNRGCRTIFLKVGDKFGRLTIAEQTTKDERTAFICSCECGGSKTVDARSLKYGHVSSCGCIKKEQVGENNPQWTGHKEISGAFWSKIAISASRRNISIEVTIEQIWDLFLKQNRKCALSKVDLYFPKTVIELGNISLDRIDSSKSYSLDNVQWIHKDLNIMKMDYTQDEYIEWCHKVAENNPRK